MTDPEAQSVEMRLYREGDENTVIELLRTEFTSRSPDRLQWQYLAAPRSRLLLGFYGGTLARVLGDAQFAGFVDGAPATIGLCGDWISRKGLGGAPLAIAVATPFFEAVATYDICLGFPRESAIGVTIIRYDARALGTMPQWVRWHTGPALRANNRRVPSVIAALAPSAIAALAAGAALARRARGRAPTIRHITHIDAGVRAGLDSLAERSRHIGAVVRRRDADYVRWRWLDQPDRDWHMLVAHDRDGALTGMAVYGIDPDNPEDGRVVDLLALDRSTTSALMADAAARLARAGAARTLCELVDGRPWVPAAMHLAGFVDRGIGPEMIALPTPRGAIAGEPGSFYLTFGDTDLC